MFWTYASIYLIILFLLQEVFAYPYYSYFDSQGRFWVVKFLFFKKLVDLNKITSMKIVRGFIFGEPGEVIEISGERKYKIRPIALLQNKSNLKLLKRIIERYPQIDTSQEALQSYLGGKEYKGPNFLITHYFSVLGLILSTLLLIASLILKI